MAKFIVAAAVCIFLLVEGTNGALSAGATCDPDTTDTTQMCDSGLTCHEKKCQTMVDAADGDCSAANTYCNTVKYTCQENKCKIKAEGTCTDATAACLANAECKGDTTKTCTCKDGFAASEDKTKCGAMGIAASMFLILATFVTSRLF